MCAGCRFPFFVLGRVSRGSFHLWARVVPGSFPFPLGRGSFPFPIMVRSTNASPNHPRRFEEEEDTGLGWPPAVSRGCPGHLEEEEEEAEEETTCIYSIYCCCKVVDTHFWFVFHHCGFDFHESVNDSVRSFSLLVISASLIQIPQSASVFAAKSARARVAMALA